MLFFFSGFVGVLVGKSPIWAIVGVYATLAPVGVFVGAVTVLKREREEELKRLCGNFLFMTSYPQHMPHPKPKLNIITGNKERKEKHDLT